MPCSSLGHHSLYSTFGQILKGTPPHPSDLPCQVLSLVSGG